LGRQAVKRFAWYGRQWGAAMKEWVMIHKIKAWYDEGRGSSIRTIAQQLRISRNTVRNYLRMDEGEIERYLSHKARKKRLEVHRAYIVHLLETYPRLSAVKVLRKLRQAHGELGVSDRTMRRFIRQLKATVSLKQARYYEPVIDDVPGVQCQVDGGELRGCTSEVSSARSTSWFSFCRTPA
jgi:transposase